MTARQAEGSLSSLAGAEIVLGVSGGIAAYKAVEICRRLVDAGAHVAPVLTEGALRFVGAATFSALASEAAVTSLFSADYAIPHTRLGRRADLVLVAPATARLIGSYAAGISSDVLTATLLATKAPVLLCPAMHTEMWEHPAVAENIATLHRRGVNILEPASGRLAGGDEGSGRLQEPEVVVAEAARILLESRGAQGGRRRPGELRDFAGRRVLVTAGGTREPIDPVRFIGNRSSGKQGYALAAAAAARGAEVTLVTTVDLPPPRGAEVVPVETAAEMANAVLSRARHADVVVMAAAVADFRPKQASGVKLHKSDGVPDILLEPTLDILAELGRLRFGQPGVRSGKAAADKDAASGGGASGPATGAGGQSGDTGRWPRVLVGFAAETDDLVARASEKLSSKRADLVVGNDVAGAGTGFGYDTNAVTIVSESGIKEVPLSPKRDIADAVLDAVSSVLARSEATSPSKESTC